MIDEIFIGGRGYGKTLELVKKSAANQIYIVCATRGSALRIAEMARELGYNIPFPITLRELPIRSRNINEVYVDDADILLEYFVGRHIKEATMTNDLPQWQIKYLKALFETTKRTGAWEEPFERNGKTYHKCNSCHVSSELILINNYCPNCGVKMINC